MSASRPRPRCAGNRRVRCGLDRAAAALPVWRDSLYDQTPITRRLRVAEIGHEQIAVLQIAQQTRASAHRLQRHFGEQRLQPRLQPRDHRLQQRSTRHCPARFRRAAQPCRVALQKHLQQVRPAVLRAEVSVVPVESISQSLAFPTSRRAPSPSLSGKCTIGSDDPMSPDSIATRTAPERAPRGLAARPADRTPRRSSDTRGLRSAAFCSAGETEKRNRRSRKRSRRSRCAALRGFPRRPWTRCTIRATLRHPGSLK